MRYSIIGAGLLILGQVVNPSGGGAPSGSAGGDLGGTYPNPTVVASHIASGTIDGTVIGGTTPAALSATTGTFTNQITASHNSTGTYTNLLSLLVPNLNSNYTQFGMGRDASTNDEVFFNYGYTAANSSNNFLAIDFYGVPNTVEFRPTGTTLMGGIVAGGTTFTVTGCGTATALKGGAMAGEFTGASTTCNPVITTGFTAPNGHACFAQDITTNITFRQTGSTTTTATFTSSGTAGATDRITFSCTAY